MVQTAAQGPLAAGKSVVVVRDLDLLSANQAHEWFRAALSDFGWTVVPRVRHADARQGGFDVKRPGAEARAVLVCIGLPGDTSTASEFGITRFAMDDYLLRLARERGVYEAVSEMQELSYEMSVEKLDKTVALLRGNGVAIENTKRILHLLRGLTGFRASAAEFAERLLQNAKQTLGESGLRNRFSPLVDDLQAAVGILSE